MKKFTEYLDDRIPVLDDPIHFKHIKNSLSEAKVSSNKPSYNDWLKGVDNLHGKNDEDISNKLHKTNKFTENHKSAIKDYTGNSEGYNRPLIKSNGKNSSHKNLVHIDDAIDKNPLNHDLHAYSGVGFDPRKKADKSGKMKSHAYISATHNKNVAHIFAQNSSLGTKHDMHIIHFHLKKGDPASHVSHISGTKEEHETVVKRGQTLKLHKTDTYDYGYGTKKVHIHHMSIDKGE